MASPTPIDESFLSMLLTAGYAVLTLWKIAFSLLWSKGIAP